MSKDSNTLVLRNYPDDDALHQPQKYPKALSFSPDIIPLYGAKADKNMLVKPASWRGFTGMPIVGGDINHVYIRGHGSGGPHVATLRVLPSELILWPQVWSAVQPVPSGPIVISTGDTPGPHASDDHLTFRPPHTTGNAYSLVANVFRHDPANEHKNLQEYEQIPSFDVQNFGVDDFVSFLSNDKNFTFYNVIVADPTLKHVSANTRLRMFGKLPMPVTFSLEWHEGAPIPDGLEVSLHDDHGKITIPRTPLSSFGRRPPVVLRPLYDGMLTLNIFSPEKNAHFEPYSGLSLKVSKAGTLDSALPVVATTSQSSQLMGALNIVFDPHSTRNLRFASPSAVQLREYKHCSGNDGCCCPGKENCVAIPTTKPVATGWWFRAQMGDTNTFPHAGMWGYTPDVQPIGTDADLTAPDLWTALQDPSIDYSKDKKIKLVGDTNNYVFVRGHSTIADIDLQTRIFAIDGAPILHPSQYAAPGKSVQGQVLGDPAGTTIDHQTVSVADPDQFYLFNKPLNLKTPPNPNPGNSGGPSWRNRPHYCIIAEVRQKRKCSPVYPSWPSEQVADFTTVQDFTNWMASNPLVCARNVDWEPSKRDPGSPCLTWTCGTQLVIPDCSFFSTFWTIVVECDNPIIPPGSKWTLTCDDNTLFDNGVCFTDLPISTQSPAYAGCHFTGAAPGTTVDLTLTITWCDGGQKIPLPSVKIRLATTEVAALSPVTHLAHEPLAGSEKWSFYVEKGYPYIGGRPNPSPLPTFANAGSNAWPYAGAPQFPVGLVALAAE